MVTIEHIIEYLERLIAEERLSGDQIAQHRVQITARLLVAAARDADDDVSARRFQVLADQATAE